jgi:hypothetical protein
MHRRVLLSTTMLSGLVGSAFLMAPTVNAADLTPLRPNAPVAGPLDPAVDGLNEKFSAYGGSVSNRNLYGVNGTVAIPLQGQFGAQIDGGVGGLDGRTFGTIAGHLFWRNPRQGLLGIYVGHTHWDQMGGVHVSQVAGEGAYYFGRFTLEGLAGIEFGNSVSSTTTGTTIVAPGGPGLAPGVATTATFIQGFDVRTRFFDQINLKYHLTDDWNAYVGHRYLGGVNALALGTEYARPLGRGVMASAFVEARVGEGESHGVWGGFKLYFGQKDKPLVARQRQDDPPVWATDTLFSITNNHTSSSSGSSTKFCGPGQQIGNNGNCEALLSSDARLKRDIVLLDRLANGIGLYGYRYLWSDTVYVGVMAQEVAAIVPQAVACAADGFLRVDYARLGLRLRTLAQWQAGASLGVTRLAA